MTTAHIKPRVLTGLVHVPPSKSDSHRALITAALSINPSRVNHLIYSEDIKATMAALEAFGAEIIPDDRGVQVVPQPLRLPKDPVDCHESGSTLRFMIPFACLVEGQTSFIGRNRLVVRPLKDYTQIFDAFKVPYDYKGQLPMTITGKRFSGTMTLSGNVSSQFYSGLFFVLPLMQEDSEIRVEGTLESKGYIDMTLHTLKQHGISIHNDQYKRFVIPGRQVYKAMDYTVEGDYSNAAFWMVAGQISGEILLKGLTKDSLQRDREIIDVITRMGGELKWTPEGLWSRPSKTRGTVIDASEIPDIIPILCVLASVSEGETRVINGQRLRIKESDRIKSTVTELSKLGAVIEETDDGMVIQGIRALKGGEVDAWQDHRIAMAMTIAASVCQNPVTLQGAEAVSKSYPHFFEDLRKLGGVSNV